MSEINFNALKSRDGTVSEADFNRLVDVCSRLVLNNGRNYTVRRSLAGTVIEPNGKGGGLTAICPFKVTLAAISGDSDNLAATLSVGTIGNFLPSNMFDSFTVAKTGTYYVKAAVVTDGQNITSVSLAVDTSDPNEQNATASSLPTTFDVVLGIIKDSKAYKTIGCGSVVLTPVLAFTTDKDSPAGPGESTTINYYIWQVTVA